MPDLASNLGRARRLLTGVALLAAMLSGCDDAASIPDVPPEVVFEGWCTAGARTYIALRLVDAEGADFDLQLRLEGDLTGTIAPGPTGSGLQGLGADRSEMGIRHLIEWGAACSDGATCADPCAALARLDLPGPDVACVVLPGSIPEPLLVRAYLRDSQDYAAPIPSETPATLAALGDCSSL
jgi:hypothetical protein